jgi:hypothetical protein
MPPSRYLAKWWEWTNCASYVIKFGKRPPGMKRSCTQENAPMNNWFTLSAHLRAPTGIDQHRYGWAAGVVAQHVADRINRSFAGPSWLRQRFPARSYVRVHLLPHNTASIGVEYLRKKNHGGSKELLCGLKIPLAWLTDRSDGLVGLREFQAALHALRAIGDHFGIGMPAAVSGDTDHGDPELQNPFVEQTRSPLRYADSAVRMERLASSMRPNQLLIAAKEPMPTLASDQRQSIVGVLGSVAERHLLGPADAKVAAWIVQTQP